MPPDASEKPSIDELEAMLEDPNTPDPTINPDGGSVLVGGTKKAFAQLEKKLDQATRTMPPTIGRIVHYSLTKRDVDAIEKRREDFRRHSASIGDTGLQAHFGTSMWPGEWLPAIVVSVNAERNEVNAQVFLDGNDQLWVHSKTYGPKPGQWRWPGLSVTNLEI